MYLMGLKLEWCIYMHYGGILWHVKFLHYVCLIDVTYQFTHCSVFKFDSVFAYFSQAYETVLQRKMHMKMLKMRMKMMMQMNISKILRNPCMLDYHLTITDCQLSIY